MTSGKLKTDIPVDDYEVAIFTNRFAALTEEASLPPDIMLGTRPGTGICEVVSYSADHQASLSTNRAGPGCPFAGCAGHPLHRIDGKCRHRLCHAL